MNGFKIQLEKILEFTEGFDVGRERRMKNDSEVSD